MIKIKETQNKIKQWNIPKVNSSYYTFESQRLSIKVDKDYYYYFKLLLIQL